LLRGSTKMIGQYTNRITTIRIILLIIKNYMIGIM